MALLTRIEEIIGIPLELFHQQKGFHPVDLSRLALRCMEQGTRQGIRQTYAPNAFTVLLHPADYEELKPFLDTISSDIKGEIQRVAEERSYLLAGNLAVTLTPNGETPEGKPKVNGMMQGEADPISTVMLSDAETSMMQPQEESERDAATVILLPADEKPCDDQIEEGISFLKEGSVEKADACLKKAASNNEDSPRFLAAKAVVMELTGRPLQAGELYQQLQKIDGPRADVQRRIEYLNSSAHSAAWDDNHSTAFSRLELSGTGASICFDAESLQVFNPQKDARVQVNGGVQHHIRLEEGDRIEVGFLKMEFRKKASGKRD
jgi:tetratricopeptide (TPR) repeat protein